MSTEPFIGEVKTFGFNFAPRGYMLCAGQTVSIAAYTALYSLIGVTYGGNGQTTFGLPDLQGRMPIGQGQGPGMPSYDIGEVAGTVSVSIISGNMPMHIHTLNSARVNQQASTATADESSPQNLFPALAPDGSVYTAASQANTFTGGTVVTGTTDIAGSSQPIGIQNPFLVINYSIAMEGIFPSRN